MTSRLNPIWKTALLLTTVLLIGRDSSFFYAVRILSIRKCIWYRKMCMPLISATSLNLFSFYVCISSCFLLLSGWTNSVLFSLKSATECFPPCRPTTTGVTRWGWAASCSFAGLFCWQSSCTSPSNQHVWSPRGFTGKKMCTTGPSNISIFHSEFSWNSPKEKLWYSQASGQIIQPLTLLNVMEFFTLKMCVWDS